MDTELLHVEIQLIRWREFDKSPMVLTENDIKRLKVCGVTDEQLTPGSEFLKKYDLGVKNGY